MAVISATATVFVAGRPPRALGLPQLRVAKAARLRCSSYSKSKDLRKKASSALALAIFKGAPLLAEASAMTAAAAPVLAPELVLALVDERVFADGTGLSNDLLGSILAVAFGLALSYTVYSFVLDDNNDDEHSSAGGITI